MKPKIQKLKYQGPDVGDIPSVHIQAMASANAFPPAELQSLAMLTVDQMKGATKKCWSTFQQ